jgi:hypothetical protein
MVNYGMKLHVYVLEDLTLFIIILVCGISFHNGIINSYIHFVQYGYSRCFIHLLPTFPITELMIKLTKIGHKIPNMTADR